MKVFILFMCFWIYGGYIMAQEKQLIYQPVQIASIQEKEISLVSFRCPGEEYQDFDMIIYPSLDSIRIQVVNRFKQELPERIVFLIDIADNEVFIASIKAMYSNETIDLNIIEFEYIGFYLSGKHEAISTKVSIPLKLKKN
jgi:hypothetical protein